MKNLQLVHYVKTPRQTYETILDLGELKPGEVFYDLGAGDFDLVFRAAKPPYNAAKSVGIELRKDFTIIAKDMVRKYGLEDKIKVIHGDILSSELDISDADLVYIYLSKEGNGRVRHKLEKQLKDSARVVSYNFFMPDWSPYSDCRVVRAPMVFKGVTAPPLPHYFYLYRMNEVRGFRY